ncbi:MAG: YidH family protein [Stackebrandtia sp.]
MSDAKEEPQVNVLRATVDPRKLNEAGKTPDYRFSLANERTFLAWLRTSLALVGGGIVVAQFLPELAIAQLRETIAAALLGLGAACALRAVGHWVRCELAMRLGRDLPASRFPTVIALFVGFGSVGLLIAVLSGAFES